MTDDARAPRRPASRKIGSRSARLAALIRGKIKQIQSPHP
jgi:hypothetical protein